MRSEGFGAEFQFTKQIIKIGEQTGFPKMGGTTVMEYQPPPYLIIY